MTTGATVTGARDDLGWTHRWWRRTGWAVLVGWLVVAGLTVTGEREASYGDLLTAIAQDTDRVTTTPVLVGEGRGYALVRITWEGGFVDRTTEVYDASSLRASRQAERHSGSPAVVDLEQRLREVRPGLVIDQTARQETSQIAGWHVPGWLGLTAFCLGVATLGLVTSGPAPWRANRWAWAWMVLSSPLGAFAFLALGGPTGMSAPPSTPGRMRGGWGFVVAILLGSVLPWKSR